MSCEQSMMRSQFLYLILIGIHNHILNRHVYCLFILLNQTIKQKYLRCAIFTVFCLQFTDPHDVSSICICMMYFFREVEVASVNNIKLINGPSLGRILASKRKSIPKHYRGTRESLSLIISDE